MANSCSLEKDQDPARPLLILAASFICQSLAGTLYWFPAIAPGISAKLGLNEIQSTFVIATANAGTVFGFLGGLFHNKYGSRITAVVGASGLSSCYLTLAVLTTFSSGHASTLLFIFALCIVTGIVTFSFGLYSACMTAAVSVFPSRYRGRVVGLSSTIYGGSAGIQSAIQAAFFSDITQISANLFFTGLLCFAAAIVAQIAFYSEKPNADSITLMGEDIPLNSLPQNSCSKHVASRLTLGYRIAIVFIMSLQFAALSDVLDLGVFMRRAAACILIAALLSFLLITVRSSLQVFPHRRPTSHNVFDEADEECEPGIGEVLRDPRGMYITGGFVFLVGGGGVAMLIQSSYLVKSLHYGPHAIWSGYPIDVIVRAFVTLFSACSVTGRLVTGAIMDIEGSANERIMWIYKILKMNFGFMGLALFLLIFPSRLIILLGVACVGLAYGSFFSTAPALTTLWFGVNSFALNFASFGAFEVFASTVLDSVVPALFRNIFGSWAEITRANGSTEKMCGGMACRLPTFLMLASFQWIMYTLGVILQPYVHKKGAFQQFTQRKG